MIETGSFVSFHIKKDLMKTEHFSQNLRLRTPKMTENVEINSHVYSNLQYCIISEKYMLTHY